MATINNASDVKLQQLSPRFATGTEGINSSILFFTKPKNLTTASVTPASITLTAGLPEWAPTTILWEYSVPSAATTWNTIAGATTSTYVLSAATYLGHLGTNNKVTYRCTLSNIEWVSIVSTKEVEYRALADDVPVITFSRETVSLPTTALDVCTYTNSGISIGVAIGGTALAYDNAGTVANTYKVTTAVTGTITVGTPSTVSDLRVYPDVSGMDGTGLSSTPTIIYTIIYRDSFNNSNTVTRTQYFSKATSSAGADAVFIDLSSESDVIAAANDGTGYTLPPANTIRIYKGGVLQTLTSSGTGLTAGTQVATQNGLTATVTSATGAIVFSGASWTSDNEAFTFNAVYGGVTYTTVYTVAKSKVGSSAVFIDLVSESDVVAAANDGTGYTLPPANTIRIYKGGVLQTLTSSGTGLTAGTQVATQNGLTATVTSATGAIVFSGASWTSDNEAFTFNAVYGGVTYTTVYTVAKSKVGAAGSTGGTGSPGTPGTPGTKAITVSCFQWSNAGTPAIPTSTALTLTWPTTVTGYPSGWAPATGSPGGTSGYVLYQLNVTITDIATASSSSAFWGNSAGSSGNTTWTASTIGSIGYRTDGSIGPQGESARIAYSKTTSGTPPTTPTPNGILAPSAPGTWSLTAYSTLADGEYMYQSDGIMNSAGTLITWGVPYLSNLKVGNLSALSALLGTVQIATTGALWSGKSTYAAASAGFFLGLDSGTPKFKIGDASDTSYLGWDGNNLVLKSSGAPNTGTYLNTWFAGGTVGFYSTLAGQGLITDATSTAYAGLLGNASYNGTASVGARIGVLGNSNFSSGSTGLAVGVAGIGNNIGVFGTIDSSAATGAAGVFGKSYSSTKTGVLAANSTSGGLALEIAGDGTLRWNGLTWAAPSGTGTLYLRNDGTWNSPAGAGTVTSVSGSGGTTGLTLTGGAITTSGTLTLGGTLAVANGGTGATTAGAALTALGAYSSSNPSGYTSNTGTVTSVSGSGGTTGLTLTGGAITTSGTLTLGGTLAVANGGTGATTAAGARSNIAAQVDVGITGLGGTPAALGTAYSGMSTIAARMDHVHQSPVNITGNAGTVTTNANLTGHVTSTGNATVLGSFTLAQLNTAVSDANIQPYDANMIRLATATTDGTTTVIGYFWVELATGGTKLRVPYVQAV